MDLSNYVYAGFPYLFIETMEIKRALKAIETEEEVTKYYWNIINGFAHLEGENANPADALEFAAKDANSKSIILAENFDQFLDDITLSQQMMNIGILLKNKQVVFAIVGTDPSLIPSCLEKLITVIDFPLPTKYEFRKIVQDLVEQVDIPYNQSVADSCVGLSLEEGENAIAYSICQDSELNMDSILKAKTAMIKKSGFMEIIHPEPIENIGGLIKIKEYVKKRLPAYEEGSTLSKLKGLFLVGIPGCLTGDTIINICRKQNTGGYRGIRLDTLYYRFNDKHEIAEDKGLIGKINRQWDLSLPTKSHCYKENDGYIGFNEIENVIYSGIKEVFEISTDHGFTIKATKDHEFLTEKGYVSLENLKKGDFLFMYKEGALLNSNTYGKKIKPSLRQMSNVGKHPNARKRTINNVNYTTHPLHRLVVEAHMNNMKLEDFLTQLEKDISNLKFLDKHLEIHHKDGNRGNNSITNLQVLTKKEHAKLHMKEGNINKYKYFPRIQKIVKISKKGKEKTYDIQMKSPDHNFIANGFIVHNCGKSLFAKVLGSILKCPVIKMDIGAMKGGIVGETEKKTRMATKIIDSQGLCVVLLDEVEKLFAGATGTVTDSSGTSQGQMGHLLTWTQERSSEAILIATSNNISALPPEFTRAGRWDSIWFFGFPNHEERKEITSIMNTKYNTNIPETDKFIEKLENWTGAEIEQLAKDSQFEELEYCMENIPIISKYKKNELKHLLEFASSVRKANSDDSVSSTKRKVSLKTIETPDDLELDSLKEKIRKKHLT